MFTGIVTEMGSVLTVEPTETGRRVVIEAPSTVEQLSIGDSVAVDGVCLTAVGVDGRTFAVDAVGETLERTTLGAFVRGTRVDLERPVPSEGGRFDGHGAPIRSTPGAASTGSLESSRRTLGASAKSSRLKSVAASSGSWLPGSR